MIFLVTAYDSDDAEASARRTAAVPAHREATLRMHRDGQILVGSALLDDANKVIGSSCYVNFPSREAVMDWINNDPFVTQKVWQDIRVEPVMMIYTEFEMPADALVYQGRATV